MARFRARAGQTRRRKSRPNYFWRRLAVVTVLGCAFYGLGWSALRLARGVQNTLAAPANLGASAPDADVLVIGGTPAGVAAAVGAARQGARVTLVAQRPKLGGDITYAFLNMFDVPLEGPHADQSPVAYGIFGQCFRELGTAFDIGTAENFLERLVAREPKISVLPNVEISRVMLRAGRVEGVEVQLRDGSARRISAAATVDATADADVAARAGAGYVLGREKSNPDRKMQAAGLLFMVSGVDWSELRAYVKSTRKLSLRQARRLKQDMKSAIDIRIVGRRAILRHGGIHGNYAWERGDVIKDYVPRGPNIEVNSINFGRQTDGSVVLNTINIVGVNGLNADSKTRAYREASQEIPLLVQYLRAHLPGFANARLARIAPELYIRETRHIQGFTTLTVDDVRRGTPFPDRVALASYALDLHPYSKGDANPFGPTRYVYSLPLRALVPRKVDGIFLASRSLSATYSAAGSARVVPITMAAGEASGIAAADCAQGGFSPHELVNSKARVENLQKELRAAGLNIGDELVKK